MSRGEGSLSVVRWRWEVGMTAVWPYSRITSIANTRKMLQGETYKLKFSFPSCCHLNGLDAFLPRGFVIESNERLMGLHTLSTFVHLECQLEHIGGR